MRFDKILLDFSNQDSPKTDIWTLEDAFKGVQIFGGIGSGKTSGSGRTLAETFLRNGFGGLVLCAKPSEREDWENLASITGRTSDLKIFCEPRKDEQGKLLENEFFFNPLDYEAKSIRKGGGETYNLVNLFMQIYQMGRVISGEGLASGGERFWDTALKRCISRLIDLLQLSGESIAILNMYQLISQALKPNEVEILNDFRRIEDVDDRIMRLEYLAESNYYVRCYLNAKKHEGQLIREGADENIIHQRKRHLQIVKNYFEREFANLAERTKTIIVESFLGLAEPFQGGILEKYFANTTTIQPEETFEDGKIIILDFPIKNYLEAGVYAQGLFKLLWQQAVERRKYKAGDIPVFLWVDESHNFLSSYDQIFQTTARSAGVCTVFLSQNISNYYVAIGGRNPTARINSLLGNLSTKIFHANNDAVTNEWAAKTIGKEFQNIESVSAGENQSFSFAKQLHWQIAPKSFTTLKNGGKRNKYLVESIITVAGREWQNDKNYLRKYFHQKNIPNAL